MNLDIWAVVKVNTNNGERIGILQEVVLDQEIVLMNDLNEQEAYKKAEELSKELSIPVFDNNEDVCI